MIQNNSSKNDIVISVIGFNSPYGTDINVCFSHTGEHKLSSLLIDDHDPQKFLKPKGQRFLNKATLIYCNIAFQAIHNRNLGEQINRTPERMGLYDGTELSNLDDCFVFDLTAKNQGPDRVSPMKAPSTIANAAASQMAIQAGIKGPNFSVCAGMAGSLQALDIASIHLKQGIIDYGIIASTEVRNRYQQSIWESHHTHHRKTSPELGISMILERRESLDKDSRKPLAIIKMLHSETYTDDSIPLETQLYTTISAIGAQHIFDIIIVSGGSSVIDTTAFQKIFDQNNPALSLLYPENTFGDLDNAGGMLGIAYAISIFDGNESHTTEKKNILVLSTDKTGAIICAVIEKNHL